jgi:hypothetical protein
VTLVMKSRHIRGLDVSEQRLLWQALTLCVLGPMRHDDDDLLHVMFGKSEDGQYRAQVDRKKRVSSTCLDGGNRRCG